jgi:hypothetical protein
MWQTGMFGIAMFLMKDWRNTPGTAEVLPFLDKVCYVPPSTSSDQGFGSRI